MAGNPDRVGDTSYGILKEYDVEHYWRDAKVLEIFEGTKEVEKALIGKRLLQ